MISRIAQVLLAASALASALPGVAGDAMWSGMKWATVDIDDGGRVVAIELEPDLTPAFEAALRHEIAAWAFEPARIDGATVPSRTHLGLHLRAHARGDGRAGVEVISVSNGPRPVHKRGMRYPPEALKRRIQGTVMVNITVAPDGSVAAAATDADANPVLRQATLRGIQQWQFEPERVDGQPVATRIRAPVVFCLALGEPCPPAVRSDQGVPARHPDQLTALDSPTRLKIDPAGRRIGG